MIPKSEVCPQLRNSLMGFASRTPAGPFVEVGVYRGGTAWNLAIVARAQKRKLHLYDTFSGTPYESPEHGDKHKTGDFSDTSVEFVQKLIPDAILHPGIFPATYMENPIKGIAFAHIDCDQYLSVKACCEFLWPNVVSGGIMIFDDYIALKGCIKAVDEFFGSVERIDPLTDHRAIVRKV